MAMEQTLRDHLFALRDAYCAHTGTSSTTVAQAACGDWRFFDKVGDAPAASFRIRTYDRACQWFADHWPADVPWPAGVERPEPTPTPAEAGAA
ncbi:hypothetical protein [Methylobacterium sp. WSM2598]|uniref:hypothetical protein n=1 Tax=Methylobacterium sp. WSM2598 TaxID=398261 RepID=UPI00037E552E|nr:hypothetical protein [Methylobacterium sp. WSM2598]